MSKKEILAYAISHAPRGQKGGPYEGFGDYGTPAASLRDAERWRAPLSPYSHTLARVRQVHPHARVICIVRARPSSEVSAVQVLRELVAWWEPCSHTAFGEVLARARRVLAASGPDPMPVVRAAMAYWVSGGSMSDGPLLEAVDAYRKAGGK